MTNAVAFRDKRKWFVSDPQTTKNCFHWKTQTGKLTFELFAVGVNFSKGCYPGQEVVARLHYLGEAKRRLFAFECDSEVQIGDNLYCKSSKTAKARGDRYKGSGTVVNTVKYNSKFYCLATLDIELIDEKITINNQFGQILTRINNE